MSWRFFIVAAVFCAAGCAPHNLTSDGQPAFCLSERRDGATEFLLQNTSDVADRAVAGDWYIFRELGDDGYRIARHSNECGANETRITFEQAQNIIDQGVSEAVAAQRGAAPPEMCWVELDATKEISSTELYRTLARAGLRYPGISSMGTRYNIGSQDDCAVVNAIGRSVVQRLSN